MLEDENIFIVERITLRMLGISPNAELDWIGRGKSEHLARAHQWYESHRIRVISQTKDLALARWSGSDNLISLAVGERQAG